MMPALGGPRKAPCADLPRRGYGDAPVRSLRLPLLCALSLWPLAAAAGEAPCWFEGGVVVAPAEVLGVAADYVLDTGAPHTLLADTQAQGAGYAETALRGEVRLAGLTLKDRPVAVAALDARMRALPTPVAGVLGADLLAGRVLDVSFAPCRIRISEPGRAPPFRAEVTLPLAWRAGRPVTVAGAADGRHAFIGDFTPATGSDTPVRLREDLADAPGAARREPLYPFGDARPTLRALSFAGALFENLPGGLIARSDLDAAGEIGAPVLAQYRVRFDFAGARLELTRNRKGPPDRSGGP